jgi:outer membrane protein OmpA-like peptidoglycan-associated protein
MRHRAWTVAAVLGVTLGTAGCATKQFVRDEVKQSETRTALQVGKVDTDLGQERTRLGQVSTQVTEARGLAEQAGQKAEAAGGAAAQAGAKADEASARAGRAQGRADEAATAAGQAMAKADQTDTRLTKLWGQRFKVTLTETVIVVFGFDRWQLDDRAQTALLDVAQQLQANPQLIVDLEGYTDSTGDAGYNVQLSQRRAEAVRRFLVEKGVEVHRLQSIGLGDRMPAADNKTKTGRDQNRRVALKLFTLAE